jgi:hypothetical protein
MTPPCLWAAVLALAAAAASCRPSGPPPAIPAELTACVPPGALLLAGARLDSLRASPLYPRLPGAARTFLEPLRDASGLLLVFNGAGILLVSQGHFREAPPGATLAGSHLMLSGSPALIQAALAQRRSGSPGSPGLLAEASAAAVGHAVWIAARGKVDLPLSGDAANLNRFLRLADFATLGLRLEAPMQLDAAAQCPTPDAARHLEESLRAFLSLAALGVSRQPQLAAMLHAVDVRREANTVRVSLTAPGEDMPHLFDFFSR